MSNFAIQLGADGKITFGNSTGVQNATKLTVTLNMYGQYFKDLGNNAINELMRVWDGTNDKLLLYCNHLFGGARITFGNSQWPGDCAALDLGSVIAGLGATSLYKLVCTIDPTAATICTATLYDTDGVTVLATGGSNANTNTNALQTTAGMGQVVMGFQGGFGAGVGMTVDYMTIGNGTSTVWDAEYNEGTGTSTTESVATITGTISGTANSWISLASPPDHGIVTLPTNPLAQGQTATATVQWYDATNTLLSPQPSGVAWSVVGGGASINGTSGLYSWNGAGSATIRAIVSGVTASATLGLSRRLTITGTMTVS